MVICLEQGADLHMAQLMPLFLTVSCFSKIQIYFAFLVPAHPGSPGQRAVKRVCVCVCVCVATVGQFSCRLSSPCTYDNIMTFGYYFPHYDPTKYIQCGYWDPVAMFAICREHFCPSGTVWDQIIGYCVDPDNIGSSEYFICRCSCYY